MSGTPWQDDNVQNWRDARPLANPIVLGADRLARLSQAIEPETTFYEIDLKDDAYWTAAGVKPDDLTALRRVIDHYYRTEQHQIDERHKTVLWDDGDHGSEFVTPEEYHRRMKQREAPQQARRRGWNALFDKLRR